MSNCEDLVCLGCQISYFQGKNVNLGWIQVYWRGFARWDYPDCTIV